MRINIAHLLAGETNKIIVDFNFSLSDEILSGDNVPLNTDIDGVIFTSPVRVTGEIINKGGYIRLTAKAAVGYETDCARCLKNLIREFSIGFERTVVVRGSLENTEDTDEYIEIVNSGLDLVSPVAEQIMMEFPLRALCREDCKGLCSKCGKDLNEGDCGCTKKEIDPRLAILQNLLEKPE